ncbi:MAG: heavy metal sensor histidine kinase [Hyphomicrobium sp.]|nr:heavy metal sensor histidine kinase [Hyphomicrobium sp.]
MLSGKSGKAGDQALLTGDLSQTSSDLPARSLSSRLMAIFFVSAFALVVAASTILYWAAIHALQYADDQVVEKRMTAVAELLRAKELNEGMIAHEVNEDNQGPRQIFIRVVSRHEPIALETIGMDAVLPVSLFPDMSAAPRESAKRLSIETGNGGIYRALSIRVPVTAHPDAGDAIIQVATDTKLDKKSMSWFTRFLGMVLAAALPMSAVVSWLLVRRELKPLEHIAAAASAVNSATLDKRLVLEGLPSELHSLGLQFNSMLGRLDQTCSELKHYADTIAHEMRTPLSRMRLESEIALSSAETADDLRGVVASNAEECERLTRLLHALLFLARTDSKQASINPQRLHLATELATIAEYFEASASAAGASISVTCPGYSYINADRELLQRALGNLVANAIAHSSEGGRIDLKASGGTACGAGVIISVSDTGHGIAAEHHARIFDRFYRAAMNTGDSGGTRLGLGLSIVKSIVELHGGQIALKSEHGKGTAFIITLPHHASPADEGERV